MLGAKFEKEENACTRSHHRPIREGSGRCAAYMQIYLYIYRYIYMYMYIYKYMYMYIYILHMIYLYIFIYIYIFFVLQRSTLTKPHADKAL